MGEGSEFRVLIAFTPGVLDFLPAALVLHCPQTASVAQENFMRNSSGLGFSSASSTASGEPEVIPLQC